MAYLYTSLTSRPSKGQQNNFTACFSSNYNFIIGIHMFFYFGREDTAQKKNRVSVFSEHRQNYQNLQMHISVEGSCLLKVPPGIRQHSGDSLDGQKYVENGM